VVSLLAYGFVGAHLDGGLPAWVGEGRRLERQLSTGNRRRASANPRLPHERMSGRSARPGILLMPRGRGEFAARGKLGGSGTSLGVPVGAMHLPGTQRLRDAAELRDTLLRANVARGRRIITYDGAGVAAAKLAFVLTVLGYEDVALYDGGWSEWGDRLDLPVDR
jgi:thiosulfate/3-mercaptopyruvate sulfurtransferase